MKVWKCLEHNNILPLYGTASDFGPYTSFVCPWMENGNLTQYLGRYGDKLKLSKRFCIVSYHQHHYLSWPDYVCLAMLISSMRWLQNYHTVSSHIRLPKIWLICSSTHFFYDSWWPLWGNSSTIYAIIWNWQPSSQIFLLTRMVNPTSLTSRCLIFLWSSTHHMQCCAWEEVSDGLFQSCIGYKNPMFHHQPVLIPKFIYLAVSCSRLARSKNDAYWLCHSSYAI